MSRFFDELERDLVRVADARARPRRSRALALPLAATLVLAVAGTAAAATFLALRSSAIAPFAKEDVDPAQRVEPGTSRVVELRAPDPDGQAPPWTLRLSRSDAGLLCTTVGQVRDGEFGLLGLDGVFRGIPEANADACGEDSAMFGTRVFDAKRFRQVRTVVNGVARDLERVTVATGSHPPRTIRHTADGAFLHVFAGYPEDVQAVLELHRRDGTRRRYEFARNELVVPDPFGERAWRLEAFGVGTPIVPGRPRPKPRRLQPGCVSFAKARGVPGRRYVLSPPVCGMEPGRGDAPQDTLYFATRRLSGDGEPGTNIMRTGDWNDHPPRVAVWGSARGHRRIFVGVRGSRFALVTRPTVNGAFLAFLPAGTRPADVSVNVDGRELGPEFGTIPIRRALP